MDILEPFRRRRLSNKGVRNTISVQLGLYAGSIVAYKDTILHLAPKMQHVLDVFEKVYRHVFLQILDLIENGLPGTNTGGSPFHISILAVVMLEEIQHLGRLQTTDPSMLHPLQQAIKCRLQTVGAIIFDLQRINKRHDNQFLEVCAALFNHVEEISSVVPQRYHRYRLPKSTWLGVCKQDALPSRFTTIVQRVSLSSLSSITSHVLNESYASVRVLLKTLHGVAKIFTISTGVLEASSFLERRLEGSYPPSRSGPQNIERAFGFLGLYKVGTGYWKAVVMIFRETLRLSLQIVFTVTCDLIIQAKTQHEASLTPYRSKRRRAVLFGFIIVRAVELYRQFFKSGMHELGSEPLGEADVIARFYDWWDKFEQDETKYWVTSIILNV